MADDKVEILARIHCSYPGLYQGQEAKLQVYSLGLITHKSRGYATSKTLEVVDEGYVDCSSLSNATLVKVCEQDISNTNKIERFYGLTKFHSIAADGYTIDRFTIATSDWKKDKKKCLKEVKKFLN